MDKSAMDDLRPLSELRADVTEPPPERLAPARRRLLRAAARPRIGRISQPFVLWLAVRPAMRPSGQLAVAVAVAAVAVLAGTQTAWLDSGAERAAGPGAHAGSAAELLEHAALVAEARPVSPKPRPDQWVYSKTLNRQPSGDTNTSEEWTRFDGRKQAGPDGIPASVPRPDPDDDELSPQRFYEKLHQLPTDPGALLAHVRADRHWGDFSKHQAGPPESADDRAFRVVGLYLEQQAFMPPGLEAAMYRALARIPNVKVELSVADGSGRRGLGIYQDFPGAVARDYLILQPRTYRYLGHTMLWLRDEWLEGSLVTRKGATFCDAVLANSIVERPGAR
jgi:hypothetical protein